MNKVNGYFALAAIFAFAALGLIFGSPNPFEAESFGDVLRDFARDTKTRTIFAMIIIDVITGVIAALRVGTFDAQRLARFYGSNVVPFVLGYALFWSISIFGLAEFLPDDLAAGVASLGFAAAMASLVASTIDNVRRAQAGASPPDADALVNREPSSAQG